MLSSLLDIIFPPVCPLCEDGLADGLLCQNCRASFDDTRITGPVCKTCGIPFQGAGEDHLCGECLTGKIPFIEARSIFKYEGAVAEAVQRFKYAGKDILGAPLGKMLAAGSLFSERIDIIIPVPLHKRRLRMRGFNQSLLLAKEAGRTLSVKVDYLNLKRIRHTEQQTRLKPEEREKNVSGAFALKDPEKVKAKNILLIDDVYTTGATIRECSKVLKKAGANPFILTLARAVKV